MLDEQQLIKYQDVLDVTPYVFVYGTLMSGNWNNRILADSELIGKGTTYDEYLLLDVGFPYAVPKDSTPTEHHEDYLAPVYGEVWHVTEPNTMHLLDRLEGEGHHYMRRLVMIDDKPDVWMYQMDDLEWASRFSALCARHETEDYYYWKRSGL